MKKHEEPILDTLSFSLESELKVDQTPNVSLTLNNVNLQQSESAAATLPLEPPSTAGSTELELEQAPLLLPDTDNAHLRYKYKSSTIFNEDLKTPCLFPHCTFICDPLSANSDPDYDGPSPAEVKNGFLQHLLLKHNFIIDDVDKIANLHKYILHWKERFAQASVLDFCVAFFMDEPNIQVSGIPNTNGEFLSNVDSDGERKKYLMITDVLPEDKELRNKLWKERLEAILEVNRYEREQQDFHRQCLFCKEIFRGNRSDCFLHMKINHSFYAGQPDNLVFIEELFDLVCQKLDILECMYCTKIFKDRETLREHMRKKQHKKINSSNPEYDRFYIVNYLEPGKSWKTLDEEEQIDERIEEDWIEENIESTSIVCLFCSFQSSSYDSLLSHMNTEHDFDFNKLTIKSDFYQKVKIVNYIRRQVYQNLCLFCNRRFLERTSLLSHMKCHNFLTDFPASQIWNQAEYFFPTYENDQFLINLHDDEKMEVEGVLEQRSQAQTMEEDDCMNIQEVVIPEDQPFINKETSALNNLYNSSHTHTRARNSYQ